MISIFDKKQQEDDTRRENRMAPLRHFVVALIVVLILVGVILVGYRVYHNLWP